MNLAAASAPALAPAMPPFRRQVRWWVLGLLLTVTIINFVDRQALSLVAPLLRDSFRLSNTQYGTIVSAFMLGMLVGEFPMGWVMDRFGPRRGLSFAVIWWSIGNALHAIARSPLHFGIFRFWLGSGECGNYSGGMKVVSQWFPARERAFAIGIFNGGSTLGSIIAPPLIMALTLRFGWQTAFLVPSALGFLWVVGWLAIYHPPDRHPRISSAELRHISEGAPSTGPHAGRDAESAPSSRSLLRVRQAWGLMLCRFLVGPVVQFYVFWMPEYLYRARGLSLREIGYFAWIPFVLGDIGSMGGGYVSAVLLKRGAPLPRVRVATLLSGAGLCLASAAVALVPTAEVAIAGICLVLFGHYFLSANMFAAISDIFPTAAVARVTALTGIAGGVSGMLFPWLTGMIVDRTSYVPVLFLASVMPLAGVLVLIALGRGFRRVSLPRNQGVGP